ncbi:MAG TPA: hypothetical protein VN665_03760 [Candidatus Paceibacterota bacterium]|nr:hypothetical protein [Candidatus Paceibacterota bacterium]
MNIGTTFQYFTYFLNPLKQEVLFPDQKDKNEIFRSILKKGKVEYESRKVKHAFVLISEKDNYFIFKLGKRASLKRHLPPDQKFEETVEETWPYCAIIINTNPESGAGQKIAFELKSNVFSNSSDELKHLEDELNTLLFVSGYALSINPVTEKQEFWKIVENNEEHIERLTLTFNSPNLFGLKNSLNQDLKDLQAEYSSTKVTLELENPDGKLVVPKNDLTTQGIDYIAQGGGEYSLKIKGKMKKVIKSKSNIKTKTFEDLDIVLKGKGQETLFNLLDKIFE